MFSHLTKLFTKFPALKFILGIFPTVSLILVGFVYSLDTFTLVGVIGSNDKVIADKGNWLVEVHEIVYDENGIHALFEGGSRNLKSDEVILCSDLPTDSVYLDLEELYLVQNIAFKMVASYVNGTRIYFVFAVMFLYLISLIIMTKVDNINMKLYIKFEIAALAVDIFLVLLTFFMLT